jgi:hypothetical protein
MGLDRPLVAVLDISGPVWELQRQLREMALACVQLGNVNPGYDYGRFLPYDVQEVMELILRDLCATPLESKGVDLVVDKLVKDGVPFPLAQQISSELLNSLLDEIGGQFPNITFDYLSNKCRYQLSPTFTMLSVIFPSSLEFDKQNVTK